MNANDKNPGLKTLYDVRFSEAERERKRRIWEAIVQTFLQRFIPAGATVIDPACGYGEALNNIRAARKIGMDLNEDAARYLDGGIEFRHGNALELLGEYANTADVVFTSNFLEHLPNKKALEVFLDKVHTSLKQAGSYIILGPNLRYLPGKYWDFFDHHLGLTHLSLVEALEVHRFSVTYCCDRFLPYTTKSKLPTHPLLVRLYCRCPWIWPLLGKQFFIVARKECCPQSDKDGICI